MADGNVAPTWAQGLGSVDGNVAPTCAQSLGSEPSMAMWHPRERKAHGLLGGLGLVTYEQARAGVERGSGPEVNATSHPLPRTPRSQRSLGEDVRVVRSPYLWLDAPPPDELSTPDDRDIV